LSLNSKDGLIINVIERLSDPELFAFVEELRDVLEKLRRHRTGEELKDEELESLRKGIVDVLDKLGVNLPLKGKVVSRLLTKKPGPLSKIMGFASDVDEIIYLLMKMCKKVAVDNMDKRVRGISNSEPEEEDKLKSLGGHVGLLCESLGRLWLKDVVGKEWQGLDYMITDGWDFDGIVESRSGDQLLVSVAEIKRCFANEDVEGLLKNLKALKGYYRTQRDRSIKKTKISQLLVLSFHSGEPAPGLWDRLRKTLIDEGYPEPSVYDLTEIRRKCQEEESSGRRILASLDLMQKLNMIE